MSSSPSENLPENNSPFFFIGNHHALDLANTLAAGKEGALDLIPDFSSFCRWLQEAKLASSGEVNTMQRFWSLAQQESFLVEAKNYRAEIKNFVNYLDKFHKIPHDFVGITNTLLRQAEAWAQVAATPYSATRTLAISWDKPNSVLGRLAETGLSLLCDCDLSLVQKCENPACVLVFYDTTKNHQRRWCSMEQCGNRHKATLHRIRIRVKSIERRED